MAASALESSLLKYSAKEYFFRAALCHLCIDSLNAQHALHRYEEQYPAFADSREAKLIKVKQMPRLVYTEIEIVNWDCLNIWAPKIVNLSFHVDLLIVLDSKNDNNSDKFIVFHVNIQHKQYSYCFVFFFASIKLPLHDIPKTDYRLNETIIFLLCCVISCRWSKKVLPQTLVMKLGLNHF